MGCDKDMKEGESNAKGEICDQTMQEQKMIENWDHHGNRHSGGQQQMRTRTKRTGKVKERIERNAESPRPLPQGNLGVVVAMPLGRD
jgi:hypothetical protein